MLRPSIIDGILFIYQMEEFKFDDGGGGRRSRGGKEFQGDVAYVMAD